MIRFGNPTSPVASKVLGETKMPSAPRPLAVGCAVDLAAVLGLPDSHRFKLAVESEQAAR